MATVVRASKKIGGKRVAIYRVKYRLADGSQKMVTAGYDQNEARAVGKRLDDEQRRIKRGDLDPQHEQRKVDRAKPIGDHLTEYKAAQTAAGNDPNHVAYTVADVRKFIDFSGVKHAASVTRPMVEAWVNHRTGQPEADRVSNTTINRGVRSLQAFLNRLHGQKVLSEYVLFKFPMLPTKGKHQARVRRPLTDDEVTKLLAVADPTCGDLYRFTLNTGARPSATEKMTVADVDLTGWTVKLWPKDKTHKRPQYTVPVVNPDVRDILARRCKGKGRTDLVWGDLPSRLADQIKADCKAGGVDTTHVDFYCLRHTFITNLARRNVHPKIVQQLADHADIATTMDFYTHWATADAVAALAMLSSTPPAR